MNEDVPDIREYCREVEDHLTRVNGGHLVRIVGPAFELVRGWAEEGVPLTVVFRGIELKAERHQMGKAARPLRLEFCEGDVRAIYEHWRRAVGFGSAEPDSAEAHAASLSKRLGRAVERLGRAAGRLELPEPLRDGIAQWLGELTSMREVAKRARGEARDAIVARLAPIARAMAATARAATPPDALAALERDAARDLAPFRDRLTGTGWQQAVDVTVDRLLRDRYDLPEL